MFFLGKALQAIGMVDVGFGLYLGMTSGVGMWRELQLTAVGLAIFYVGRLVERRG